MVTERRARISSLSILLGAWAGCALLLVSVRARAAEPAVWYRAGENCPDGARFLERLARRGVSARLAQAGDQVDFVVTMGPSADGSSGRLERQTSSGTIAIRQVEDAKCEAVAEALALTLALTFEPASQATVAARPEPEVPPAIATAPRASLPAPAPPAPPPPPLAQLAPPRSKLSLGAQASAWDVFEGPWLLAAGVFADLEAPASFVLPRASLRGVVHGARRFDGDAAAQLWLAAARVEGCPLGLELGRLDLRPCAAFDLGAIGASAAGVSDVAWWLSAAAHARAAVSFGRLALEAQLGAVLPLTRYEVSAPAPAPVLEHTKIIGLSCGLGARFTLE